MRDITLESIWSAIGEWSRNARAFSNNPQSPPRSLTDRTLLSKGFTRSKHVAGPAAATVEIEKIKVKANIDTRKGRGRAGKKAENLRQSFLLMDMSPPNCGRIRIFYAHLSGLAR